MTKGDEVALCELLRQQKPVTAIVGKAVELVREMSDRPQAQGTIGKQLMSLVISPDLSQDPAGQYHSGVVSEAVYFPSRVIARSAMEGALALRQPEIRAMPSPG